MGKKQRETFPQISIDDIKRIRIPANVWKFETQLIEIYDQYIDRKVTDIDLDNFIFDIFELNQIDKVFITKQCMN